MIASIFVYFVTSLVSAYYTRELCMHEKIECNMYQITLIRILINDTLFVVLGFTLSGFLFKLARLSMSYIIPEQDVIFNLASFLFVLSQLTTTFLRIYQWRNR